jgi:endo-1,4-beta-D-glucanase Y
MNIKLIQFFKKTINLNTLPYIITFIFVGFIKSKGLFIYPYFENDEGVYTSQAWSLLEKGELSHYTYWYDHAPFGWLTLGIIIKLLGGYFAFGLNSIEVARIAVLILNLISTCLIARIVWNITNNKWASLFSMLVFTLSPLVIYHQRRVLLDNIMVFWLIISINLLTEKKIKLSHVLFSGVFFGLGFLSKESALFLVPPVLFYLWNVLEVEQRVIGIYLWFSIFLSSILLYILMAIYKTELFPSNDKVSLISTILFHSKRGNNITFYLPNSDFMNMINEWSKKDNIYTYMMFYSTILMGLLLFFRKINIKYKLIFLFQIFYVLFLIRGGIVFEFYIIPMFSIISISIPLVLDLISKFFDHYLIHNLKIFKYILITTLVGVVIFSRVDMFKHPVIFTKDENLNIKLAIDWIRDKIPADKKILIDNSNWLDLKKNSNFNEYDYAHWYWKTELDSFVRKKNYNSDWRNVDYAAATLGLYEQIGAGAFEFNKSVLDNSYIVADFQNTPNYKVQHNIYRAINGDWTTIFKVDNDKSLLDKIWTSFKEKNITLEGRVVENNTNFTESATQSEAILSAVRYNDKQMFDKLLNWSNQNLKNESKTELFSTSWGNYQGVNKILNYEYSTEYNLKYGLAILMGFEKWKDPIYLDQGIKIINQLKSTNFKSINNKLLPLYSNTDSNPDAIYNFTTSSCNTYAMSYFTKFQSEWNQLKLNCYELLKNSYNQIDYIPEYASLSLKDGIWTTNPNNKGNTKSFNDNGFNIYNYIAFDQIYYNTKESREIANKYTIYINDKVNKYGFYNSSINNSEEIIYPLTPTLSAVSNLLKSSNSGLYTSFWKNNLLSKFNYDEKDIIESKNTKDSIYFISSYLLKKDL